MKDVAELARWAWDKVAVENGAATLSLACHEAVQARLPGDRAWGSRRPPLELAVLALFIQSAVARVRMALQRRRRIPRWLCPRDEEVPPTVHAEYALVRSRVHLAVFRPLARAFRMNSIESRFIVRLFDEVMEC